MATKTSEAKKAEREKVALESRLEAMEKSIASLTAQVEALTPAKPKKPATAKGKK